MSEDTIGAAFEERLLNWSPDGKGNPTAAFVTGEGTPETGEIKIVGAGNTWLDEVYIIQVTYNGITTQLQGGFHNHLEAIVEAEKRLTQKCPNAGPPPAPGERRDPRPPGPTPTSLPPGPTGKRTPPTRSSASP